MIRRATVLGLTVVMSLMAAGMMPDRAAAQSDLDAAQAQEFMGQWLVTFETPDGPFLVELDVADEGGKVAVSAITLLGTQRVTDVTRSDDKLVLSWEADAQGQLIPLLVEITSDGDELAVSLELGMGDVTMTGVGTRMEG
ncbi:MAG: hypothetical protein OEO79_04330 [Gemmatimonadota bacterium]|nr:hypothetical protein [Gemmatimonadota bacterium]MDH3421607.1 hypothetical protein [Gemmatimonadota bacterium]